jgi:hypothetical protein
MRTLLIGALAATLVGCSCLLPPQASMEACTNGFACFDRTTASQPIELASNQSNCNVRVRPETSRRIAEFSKHEAD